MSEVTIIGIDLAKRVFHLYGARGDGSVVLRKKLSRAQLLAFIAEHPKCIIAMEAVLPSVRNKSDENVLPQFGTGPSHAMAGLPTTTAPTWALATSPPP